MVVQGLGVKEEVVMEEKGLSEEEKVGTLAWTYYGAGELLLGFKGFLKKRRNGSPSLLRAYHDVKDPLAGLDP